VARLGADSVVNRNKGGTDDLSFLPYGVPGFNFNQLERGYNHTHHSQSDSYDMAIRADLTQASAVMAVTAYELANLSALIQRGERTAPTPVEAVKVSDSLLVKGKRRKTGAGYSTSASSPLMSSGLVCIASRPSGPFGHSLSGRSR